MVLLKERLFRAAKLGNVERVRELGRMGADVTERDGDGRTAMHFAAMNEHVEVSLWEALVALGADMEAPAFLGVRPMHMAAARGHTEVVRALVAMGADKEAQADAGVRPLHLAALGGHVEVLRALVVMGADKEAEAALGMRPLHSAAISGHAEAVDALVQLGVELNAWTTGGETERRETAHTISIQCGYPQVTHIFAQAAARNLRAAAAAARSGGEYLTALAATLQVANTPLHDRPAAAEEVCFSSASHSRIRSPSAGHERSMSVVAHTGVLRVHT
jgi:hypothetical protein